MFFLLELFLLHSIDDSLVWLKIAWKTEFDYSVACFILRTSNEPIEIEATR